MSVIKQYLPFWLSALQLCLLVAICYPFLQYYIDPDGTAYLTIARRYASGDYATAINGYWSPWSCWLTAIGMRCGMAAIPASIFVNTLGALAFLWISQSLFIRLEVNSLFQRMLCMSLSVFLCFAVFYQTFDDLWECFFLLAALRLFVSNNYWRKFRLWLLTGALGALAYFAKAYAFPFFILFAIGSVYCIADRIKVVIITMTIVIIPIFLLCSAPWLVLLHQKYDTWTTSTAGTLNTSWYLVGHPFWNPEYQTLLPPAYKDSPYYWEDPYLVNSVAPHFWDSPQLFGMQLLRIVQNVWKLFCSMLQISVFFPLVFIMLFRIITRQFAHHKRTALYIVILSFFLFPIGYFLVNFEQRYIWFMIPGSMIGGLVIFESLIKQLLSIFPKYKITKRTLILPTLFIGSYMWYPAYWLASHINEGKHEYVLATELKKRNIIGSFCSNALPGIETQKTVRLAYFAGNPYYTEPVATNVPLAEIRKYNIKYYLYYYRTGENDSCKVLDENQHAFPIVYADKNNHVAILELSK